MRDRLLAAGIPSRIYTELPDPATVEETRRYQDYETESVPGDVLVYQFATESAIADWLVSRPEPVVVNYHSITPPEYFGPWNNGITRGQVGASRSSPAWPRRRPWVSPIPGSTPRSSAARRLSEDHGHAGGGRGRPSRSSR